jgi:hypothetical protein
VIRKPQASAQTPDCRNEIQCPAPRNGHWDQIAAEVAREFPHVTWDKMLVDAMTARMTLEWTAAIRSMQGKRNIILDDSGYDQLESDRESAFVGR